MVKTSFIEGSAIPANMRNGSSAIVWSVGGKNDIGNHCLGVGIGHDDRGDLCSQQRKPGQGGTLPEQLAPQAIEIRSKLKFVVPYRFGFEPTHADSPDIQFRAWRGTCSRSAPFF